MGIDQILQIIWLAVIIFIIGAVIFGIIKIRLKIREIARQGFGTDSFWEGYKKKKKELSETPRSVHGMTSIYLPQIQKDFPEFEYELYKNKAQSLLHGYFTAIADKNPEALLREECTPNLVNYVRGIVEDLNAQNHSQVFAETVLHATEISRYIKTGATVTVMFNIAVGQYSYILDDETGKIVFGDKELKKQTIYNVGLVYVQNADMAEAPDGALGINCPNCGAPIRNIGNKFCEYCGTAVKEINIRAWSFDSVHEETNRKTVY